MSLGITLTGRALSLFGVLIVVLFMIVVALGATGFSDRILGAIVNEEMRGIREGLAQTIRNPDELEQVLNTQREEREKFYGLDKKWHQRLPDMLWRLMVLDLGEARSYHGIDGFCGWETDFFPRLHNSSYLIINCISIHRGLFLITSNEHLLYPVIH